MITKETIDKIELIFRHMQLVEMGVQEYNPLEEYRMRRTIKKGMPHTLEGKLAYCHAVKLTDWHLKIWNKRHTEIPHAAFILWIPEAKVYRIGFKG